MSRFLQSYVCAFLFALISVSTPALALDPPAGPVLLTVSGAISDTNSGDSAEFDREMLQALDWREIEAHTFSTVGKAQYAGPTLASLLDYLGVQDGMLTATALDDYQIEIPVSDAETYDVLLALDKDGRPMRVRDKGPIWIIYPSATLDEVTDYKGSRMIWQLNRIAVKR